MNLPKIDIPKYSSKQAALIVASFVIGKLLSMVDGARFEEETREIVRDEMRKMNGGQ